MRDLNAAGTPFATYTNWAGNVSGLAGFWSDQTGSFTLQATGDSAMFISLITAGYEFNASGSFHQNWFDVVPLSSTVPLPAALRLFASGLVGLGWLSRRRRKQLQAG